MRRALLPTELKACVNAPPGWHRTEGQRAVVERTRPTAIGGKCRIRTCGAFTPGGFQDRFHRPLGQFPVNGGADGRIGTCITSYQLWRLCRHRPSRASSPCLLHHIRIQVAALRTDRLFCGPDLRIRRLPADEGLALDTGPDHRIISAAHAPTRCTPKVRSWSDRRALNPQPSAWKADALPIELLPH